MSDTNFEILWKETYLKAIENSVGSRFFNSLYVKDKQTGQMKDILEDGIYSCAFFVISLLYFFRVLEKSHSTVKGLYDALGKQSGWQNVGKDRIESGDVIFWEKIEFDDGTENARVGFAVN